MGRFGTLFFSLFIVNVYTCSGGYVKRREAPFGSFDGFGSGNLQIIPSIGYEISAETGNNMDDRSGRSFQSGRFDGGGFGGGVLNKARFEDGRFNGAGGNGGPRFKSEGFRGGEFNGARSNGGGKFNGAGSNGRGRFNEAGSNGGGGFNNAGGNGGGFHNEGFDGDSQGGGFPDNVESIPSISYEIHAENSLGSGGGQNGHPGNSFESNDHYIENTHIITSIGHEVDSRQGGFRRNTGFGFGDSSKDAFVVTSSDYEMPSGPADHAVEERGFGSQEGVPETLMQAYHPNGGYL